MSQTIRRFRWTLLAAAAVATASPAGAQQPAAAPTLKTPWAAQVSDSNPWPEYPRPQLVRSEWQNLNGRWDYAITDSAASTPRQYDGAILVPYAVESQLSGVRRAVTDSQRLWYRRTFAVPQSWRRGRVLLHFGAVDWDATVFVNGHRVGAHRGGYDPFTLDITDALASGTNQQLIVSVWDPTDRGGQPRGKQVLKPHSIWYTAVTGIWQSVWLEPVPSSYVTSLLVVPNVDDGRVTITARVAGRTSAPIRVAAFDGDHQVAVAQGRANQPIALTIPDAKLWGPGHPFLYDLRITAGADSVRSYFGMRKIALGRDSSGTIRLFLNNAPLFQFGVLDQGWWPGGLYTPPTERAMLHDLTTIQTLGFNLIRKHVKVESARWYHAADSLGILLWQDMPSGDNDTPEWKAEYGRELEHMVDALRNHPAIVMWVPFNEGWGQFDTEHYVAWLKSHDPTRLVDNASGWTDHGVGDVIDLHVYPGPGIPPRDSTRARVLGEFGGLGLPLEGHTWLSRNNWGYRTYKTRAELSAAYIQLMQQLRILRGQGLAAAVYTQPTDVEVEVNGLMTYDREVLKLTPEAIAATRRVMTSPPVVHTLVATSADSAQKWSYTTEQPDSAWYQTAFDDSGWSTGPGGFGTDSTPGARVHTEWDSGDIWLRRHFQLDSIPGAPLYLVIHHDEDAEVYLNGTLVGRYPDYTADYIYVPLPDSARAGLHPGSNVLAMHVHQTRGGQYADAGLAEVIDREAKVTSAPFGQTDDGKAVTIYTLDNGRGMRVRAMTYGGIIQQIIVPDRDGHPGDVVLGFDSLPGYLDKSPYFGAIVGRYANRIAHGRFTLDGKTYQLATNDGPNALHGGIRGFDKVVWEGEPIKQGDTVGVRFRYTSADGEEGYPGTLRTSVTYKLTPDNRLMVDYEAVTDKATPINLSQHSYFNLAGEGSGDVLGQVLTINADGYTPIDSTFIPTGAIAPVAGTPFDFRKPTPIGARIGADNVQLRYGKGYDHNFVLNRSGPGLTHAVHLLAPSTGRTLDIYTTQPGLQFYSGNFLDGSIVGKSGHRYVHRGAVALETQHYPDSPNHPNFPSTILRPGERYHETTVFEFGTGR
ncbi:MAG TPA: galactose-1-epimerase [Gemmatimonadales bacterium]|nr:galactose-1-epimerase [Gemmatimonadales bacterium]